MVGTGREITITIRRSKMTEKVLSPLRAIRAMCLECCGGSQKEVRLCPTEDCSLYSYRFGHNPKRKGIGSVIGPRIGRNVS
jgi:hypothetical protein